MFNAIVEIYQLFQYRLHKQQIIKGVACVARIEKGDI